MGRTVGQISWTQELKVVEVQHVFLVVWVSFLGDEFEGSGCVCRHICIIYPLFILDLVFILSPSTLW